MSLRRFLPLFLLILISFTIMTYQSNKGITAPLGFIGKPLDRVNALVHSISSAVREPFRKMLIRESELRRLREENGRLLALQEKYRELVSENERLREILLLRERERRYVAAARVVSKGWDRWANTIIIDKGVRDGVAKDMAVITPLGLVGKVVVAGDRSSQVLLITDLNFSASVKVQETRQEAIYSGTGNDGSLKYISREDPISEGSVVVTSGFDGLFPAEVPVGYVSRATNRSSDIFQDVVVRPFQDLTRLDEVAVVKR